MYVFVQNTKLIPIFTSVEYSKFNQRDICVVVFLLKVVVSIIVMINYMC